MSYIENPKTKGSGIVCAIPQTGTCPNKCEDCFFQSGRSYLEPLDKNLPNMPDEDMDFYLVRVNDGNDSNVDRETVEVATCSYRHRFYNTAIPKLDFPAPVVLTVNPSKMTDVDFHKIRVVPKNLMFVRFRANTWNIELQKACIQYYSNKDIPVVLTFMAYYDKESVPVLHRPKYVWRKRTLNSYWAITTSEWRQVMYYYRNNKWVHSCGKIEGELGDTHCRFCGNCLREYFATITRMNEA